MISNWLRGSDRPALSLGECLSEEANMRLHLLDTCSSIENSLHCFPILRAAMRVPIELLFQFFALDIRTVQLAYALGLRVEFQALLFFLTPAFQNMTRKPRD